MLKPKEPEFTDITVVLANRPGTLAAMGQAMGKAGVNIEGLCGAVTEGPAAVHILVKDAAAARRALQAGGFEIAAQREVMVLAIEDRPGALGEFAAKVAKAGVNIDLVYTATNTRLVIGADDLDKAWAAL